MIVTRLGVGVEHTVDLDVVTHCLPAVGACEQLEMLTFAEWSLIGPQLQADDACMEMSEDACEHAEHRKLLVTSVG